MPRCLTYNPFNCDLYIGSSSSSLYRLNLEVGKFQKSFGLSSECSNKILLNPYLNCIYSGGENGVIDLIDFRQEELCGSVKVNEGQTITAMNQFSNAYEFFVGSDEGLVYLYDIRSDKPVMRKEHPYGFPINSIEMHPLTKQLITTDKKCIRVSEKDSDELFFMYEPKHDINNLTSNTSYKLN